ncbi:MULTISPECIES: hypothetical protein [Staphylococcus]|uniref:hypothetical protein n=1 Tax=Staphylococcus TaxID=1279 RepID=UPI001F1C9BC9|nr:MULTISPECIES: hypothetical protein [Staphylococcus]
MTVYINNINPSNVNEVKQLKVNSKQMNFIETVHECLNEAEKFSQWCPVAIYNDNEIVGFAMYGCFGKKKKHGLIEFSLMKNINVRVLVEKQ